MRWLLIFLLVALGVQIFEGGNRWTILGFIMVGLSLWLPATFCDFAGYALFQFLAWFLGLTILLLFHPSSSRETNKSSTESSHFAVG